MFTNGHFREDSKSFSVFGDEADSGVQGLVGVIELYVAAFEFNSPLGRFCARTKQTFQQLSPPGSHQSGDAEHFASTHAQADILQTPLTDVSWPREREVFHT